MKIYFKFCFFLVVLLLEVVVAKPPALANLENDIEARRLNANHVFAPIVPYSCATCGGTCNTLSGNITSPNYPNRYPNNLDCSILIRVPIGNRIELNYTDFNTELGDDYVTVYDGGSTSSLVISSLSGTPSISYSIVSTSNQMLVRFTTDDTLPYPGWSANFNTF